MISEKEYLELLIIITESFDHLERRIEDHFASLETRMRCNEIWMKRIAEIIAEKDTLK